MRHPQLSQHLAPRHVGRLAEPFAQLVCRGQIRGLALHRGSEDDHCVAGETPCGESLLHGIERLAAGKNVVHEHDAFSSKTNIRA